MSFLNRIHRERQIDNFTVSDGTISFYSLVRAAILRVPARKVLDYGAGRGEQLKGEGPSVSLLRQHFQDLRFNGTHVVAADVSEAVKTHPASHEQVVFDPKLPLPFADGEFDVIVSDWTFEHIEHPEQTAAELMRVLAPGGYLCARTPNNTGYLRMCSQLIPNSLHARVLSRVQPDRLEEDIFPTWYRMNSPRQIRRLFPGCEIIALTDYSDPSYYFGSSLAYRVMLLGHRCLPAMFAPVRYYFIRKIAS